MNKAFFLINEQDTLCSSQSSAYNKTEKLSKKYILRITQQKSLVCCILISKSNTRKTKCII